MPSNFGDTLQIINMICDCSSNIAFPFWIINLNFRTPPAWEEKKQHTVNCNKNFTYIMMSSSQISYIKNWSFISNMKTTRNLKPPASTIYRTNPTQKHKYISSWSSRNGYPLYRRGVRNQYNYMKSLLKK